MKILQISTLDIAGGAEKVARNLFKAYLKRGHQSRMAVGYKRGNDRYVLEIPHQNVHPPHTQALFWLRDWLREQNQHIPGMWRFSNIVDWVAQPAKRWDRYWGIEYFHYPGSRRLLTLLPEQPDIIHAHNLHGGYFDLRFLPKLSRQVPLVITLHDEWMLTGHCAYTINCPRWELGCGSCPDLQIYPAIKRDGTAWNWRRKKNIYRHSTLYIATPSQWLMDRVRRSMLVPVEGRVIHNGIDLSLHHPDNRTKVRSLLDLPKNDPILLFAASSVQNNPFKDYETILKAIHLLVQADLEGSPITFIALGSDERGDVNYGQIRIRHIGYQSDPSKVAQYFQAADIYLHAARAENFPNTILEALACGTPVVATAVGGIPEQIEEGVTGFLVPPGDSKAMAHRIIQLLTDEPLRQQMGAIAAETARYRFDLNRQVDDYLNWYQEILNDWCAQNKARNPQSKI